LTATKKAETLGVVADSSSETLAERLNPERHPFHSTTETLAVLGVDRYTLIEAIHRGEVPATRIGRAWRIPTAWLQAQVGLDEVERHNEAAKNPPPDAPAA
jgi:excisionase family DNA binding protein